jgi:hypothetical protein
MPRAPTPTGRRQDGADGGLVPQQRSPATSQFQPSPLFLPCSQITQWMACMAIECCALIGPTRWAVCATRSHQAPACGEESQQRDLVLFKSKSAISP